MDTPALLVHVLVAEVEETVLLGPDRVTEIAAEEPPMLSTDTDTEPVGSVHLPPTAKEEICEVLSYAP